MFQVNNKDTTRTPGVVMVFLLLTFNIFHTTLGSSVSTVNFEHVNTDWEPVFRKWLMNFNYFRKKAPS